MKKHYPWVIPGILVIVSLAVRIYVLCKVDNCDGSVSMGRIVQALAINKDSSFSVNFDPATSMLYAYILAGVLRLWPDPLLAPRIFSLIFGVLAVIPFYFTIRLLCNKRVAFFSSLLFCLYPQHAIQSTLSTPDVFYYFFLFSGAYYLFKCALREEKIPVVWLVLSALFLNIAALLRYESWSLLPVFGFFLIKKGKRYVVFFLSMVSVAPLLWMYLCNYHSGNPLQSFLTAAATARIEIIRFNVLRFSSIWGWITVLSKNLGSVVVVTGLAGIVYALWRKKCGLLAVLFVYIFVLYTGNTLAGRMWHNERYAIIMGLLLLPYTVLCVEMLVQKSSIKPEVAMCAFVIVVATGFMVIADQAWMCFKAPRINKELGGWLKQRVESSARIMIENDGLNYYDQELIVRSGFSPKSFLLISAASPSLEWSKQRVEDSIRKDHFRYLLMGSHGYLQQVLRFPAPPEKGQAFGCSFWPVSSYATGSFIGAVTLYKIDCPSSTAGE